MNVSSSLVLILAVAGGFSVLFGLIGFWGINLFKSHRSDASYDSQLQEMLTGEGDEDDLTHLERGRSISERWRIYWQNVGKATGLPRYSEKLNKAHIEILYLAGALVVTITAFTRNPILGLFIPIGLIYLVSVIAKARYNKQQSKIQDQIPGFLFALKANIQANETPVRAILKIVDNMPDPLRADLTIVKQKILANSSFAEALQALLERTSSNELRFLASCLIQAASTGANIEPQINTIQHVLEQRRKAADELSRAVKATLPAIWISSFVIPATFLATYTMDPAARAFWFKTPLSYFALVLVVGLWGLGMFITRKMVENIRDL